MRNSRLLGGIHSLHRSLAGPNSTPGPAWEQGRGSRVAQKVCFVARFARTPEMSESAQPVKTDGPTTLQGGPSGCKLPFVAVPSQYGLLILKRSFQFHVNNRMCTTRWTTVYTDTKLSCPVLSASSVLCECIGHKNAHKWIGFSKHS